jgi:glycerol kinase
MGKYIISIDQGTSGTKALLFDARGRLIQRHNENHEQYYPQPGWVEHNASEIFEKTIAAIDAVVKEAKITPEDVAAVSISNQRETAVVWDKVTGEPIYNAVVWQCARAIEICDELIRAGYADMVREKTGLVLSPYFSASKIKWILDNVDGARKKAEEGRLAFGTIDSWLVYKFTKGKVHATDYSNASRTQLFNIKELRWDKELLSIFTIPESMAPELKSSNEIFGTMEVSCLSGYHIPVAGILGDSHAALFGQNCFELGMAKVTYGTGSSIMMNIGKSPYDSRNSLVTSIGWAMDGVVEYVAEGNINCSGATIKWMIDDLELLEDSKSTETLAASLESNDGVYLVPAFVGLGAPYWDSSATAMITGMTRGTKKAHIVRATLESMAYQVKDILDIMTAEASVTLKEIRVDGGPTRNKFLMQFQADILNTMVVVNQLEELSGIGAAYMAGLAVGLWKDKEEIKTLRIEDTAYVPVMSDENRKQLYKGWKEAVLRVLMKVNEK